MGYFKPSEYTIKNALKEATRYDGIYVGVIMLPRIMGTT